MGRKVVGSVAVYEVRREGWRSFFELRVAGSKEGMRSDIRRYFRKRGLVVPEGLGETLGLVCPVMRLESVSGRSDGLFAVLFLCEERCGTEILCHECLHVALAYERHVLLFGMDYGDACGENEERLAYFQGRVMAGVVSTLREHGHLE